MNKREIATAFNNAKKDTFTKLPVKKALISDIKFENNTESQKVIDETLNRYCDLIFTKAVRKKIVYTKTIAVWPHNDDEPFAPYIDSVDVYRYGNKYVCLIKVLHCAS